jgi:hypothetical protein
MTRLNPEHCTVAEGHSRWRRCGYQQKGRLEQQLRSMPRLVAAAVHWRKSHRAVRADQDVLGKTHALSAQYRLGRPSWTQPQHVQTSPMRLGRATSRHYLHGCES